LDAAARGVQICIITQGKSDTPFMRWASTYIYHRYLSSSNITIYEYESRILHAKTVTIDGVYNTIGSFNLDFLSGSKNLEINVSIVDQQISEMLQKQFEIDLKQCKQITMKIIENRNVLKRILHACAYYCSKIIYAFI
jgi:cardiolipin synthase